jgi:hypothetical protein
MEGSCRGLTGEKILEIAWKNKGKTQKPSVRKASLRIEI